MILKISLLCVFYIPAFCSVFCYFLLSCSAGKTVSFSFSIQGIPETELRKSSPSYMRVRAFSVNPDYVGRKFFVSFPRYISVRKEEKSVRIEITTDFPDSISAVISRGFFGGVKVLPMKCEDKAEEKRKLCTAEVGRDELILLSMGGKEPIFFWFMLKVGKSSYYTVPNIKIIQRGKRIHEVLGRIYVE